VLKATIGVKTYGVWLDMLQTLVRRRQNAPFGCVGGRNAPLCLCGVLKQKGKSNKSTAFV